MTRVVFDTFAVTAPQGWADITDTVESENPPFTLSQRDGVGALQFSIALYRDGPMPNVTPADLKQMLEQFGRVRSLGEPAEVVVESGPPLLAGGTFDWGNDFLRAWEISDGRNFAFVTYICTAEYARKELSACEQIVRSITFRSGK